MYIEPRPISDLTSDTLLLSRPLAVNLAYSLSATDALLIQSALVLDIPKVRQACLPSRAVCRPVTQAIACV